MFVEFFIGFCYIQYSKIIKLNPVALIAVSTLLNRKQHIKKQHLLRT